MGLDVICRRDDGSVIGQIPDPESHLASVFETLVRAEFPSLSRIDMYRGTCLPAGGGIVEELMMLRDRESRVAAREHLSRVIGLCRGAEMEPETTVEFQGD